MGRVSKEIRHLSESQHLAAKGWKIPRTLNRDLPCEEWDKRLEIIVATPPLESSSFVTFDTFKWVLGGVIGAISLAFGAVFAAIMPLTGVKLVLEKHIAQDEKWQGDLLAKLANEHTENQVRMADMERRLRDGQGTVLIEVHKIREFFEQYILRQPR